MVSAQPRTPTKGFNKNYLKIKYFEQEKRVLPYVPRELLVLPHRSAKDVVLEDTVRCFTILGTLEGFDLEACWYGCGS